MKSSRQCDFQRTIPALIYGELPEDEASQIREHCQTCPACRSEIREFSAVQDMLESRPVFEPIRPVWPQLLDQLALSTRPWSRPVFAFETGLAAAVGILIGVLVGSMTSQVEEDQYLDTWSAVGSSITQDPRYGLPNVYLASAEEKEG